LSFVEKNYICRRFTDTYLLYYIIFIIHIFIIYLLYIFIIYRYIFIIDFMDYFYRCKKNMHMLEKFCSIIWAKAGKGVYVFWRGNSIAILSREYVLVAEWNKRRRRLCVRFARWIYRHVISQMARYLSRLRNSIPTVISRPVSCISKTWIFSLFPNRSASLFSTFIAGELFVVK